MKKALILFITVLTTFVCWAVFCLGQIYWTKDLIFKTDKYSNEDISILVENESVIRQGNLLIPISFTTLRPVSISVDNQTKHVTTDVLSRTHLIPLDIIFRDKKTRYYLQTLPLFFPEFSVQSHLSPTPAGFILISVHGMKLTDPAYSFIIDMDGRIVFYRGHPEVNRSMFHLKKVTLPNGKVRYITHVQDGWGLDNSYVVGYHLIMDENFHEIDRVKILKTQKHDALPADEHDILMFDDGHYIVTGQDIIETPLADGKKSLITHSIIQEQQNGKVLLDWDSQEYPQLMAACYEKCPELHDYNADYIHINSLAIDPKDNHLLVSSASGYYIMKLHRKTGEILWILGGKANQFQIPNGAEFIRQHHVYSLPDGRLIMFDNHFSSLSKFEREYHHFPLEDQKAQILILDLDEKNKAIKSAQKIPLNFWSPYMGSVQKLSDNRCFIGCGDSDDCTARMIDGNGTPLWNMQVQPPYKMFRAYYYNSLD